MNLIVALVLIGLLSFTQKLLAHPDQYCAVLLSEVLGRGPDPYLQDWATKMQRAQSNGSSLTAWKDYIKEHFLSQEFNNLNYTNEQKIFVIYRAVLLRDPDVGGFNNYVNILNQGYSISYVLDAIMNSSEFINSRFQYIISLDQKDPFIWSGANPIYNSTNYNRSETELRNLLNSAQYGDVIELRESERISITSKIVIPPGVTLRTSGNLNRYQYAKMARLVRMARFDGPVIELRQGAKLESIWIDGKKEYHYWHAVGEELVMAYGNNIPYLPTIVTKCKLSEPTGWTAIKAQNYNWAEAEGYVIITNNIVTAYNSRWDSSTWWSDGISVGATRVLVQYNFVIDATDVGIVLFGNDRLGQKSIIRDNYVSSPANNCFAAIGVDPGHIITIDGTTYGTTGNPINYNGCQIKNNAILTGRYSFFQIGVSNGIRSWGGIDRASGTGVLVEGNSFGLQASNSNFGISITNSGIFNTYVTGNIFNTNLSVNYLYNITNVANIAVDSAWTSGSIQTPYSTMTIFHIIGVK